MNFKSKPFYEVLIAHCSGWAARMFRIFHILKLEANIPIDRQISPTVSLTGKLGIFFKVSDQRQQSTGIAREHALRSITIYVLL